MKSTKIVFLLFFLTGLLNSQAQTKRSKADSLLQRGEIKKAIVEFRKTITDSSDRDVLYNYACAFALIRQNDSAFHYLYRAVAHDSGVLALTDPDLLYLSTDPRWHEFEDSLLVRVEMKHGKYPNIELSKELWRMKMRDQAYYYHLEVAEKNMDDPSVMTNALWRMKHELNKENVKRLTEIIDSVGWPGTSEVKGSAAGAAFLIVQHADIKTQEKYLPLMRAAADSGEASWSSLALLIDRVNLRQGKQQIYGSQIYRNEDGTFYVKDLKDPEYVDQRRREVGLRPIAMYVKMWGIEWNIEQKEK